MLELNTVIRCEENGILMYENFLAKFQSPIFSQILTVKRNGLELLKQFNPSNLNVNADENGLNFISQSNPETYEDALIIALSYEIKQAQIYDSLTNTLNDESLKDLVFRIWATSENEYKPALKAELFSLNTGTAQPTENVNLENKNSFDEKHLREFSDIFQKFSQGKADKKDILNLLNNPNISLFSGLAVGSLGGVLINQFLSQKDSEE